MLSIHVSPILFKSNFFSRPWTVFSPFNGRCSQMQSYHNCLQNTHAPGNPTTWLFHCLMPLPYTFLVPERSTRCQRPAASSRPVVGRPGDQRPLGPGQGPPAWTMNLSPHQVVLVCPRAALVLLGQDILASVLARHRKPEVSQAPSPELYTTVAV